MDFGEKYKDYNNISKTIDKKGRYKLPDGNRYGKEKLKDERYPPMYP